MGLDTDDIVAIPIFIVSAIVFGIAVILCATQRIIVIRLHMLEKLLTKKHNIYMDKNNQPHEKSMLWTLIGDQKYFQFIAYLKKKYGGELPSSSEITELISPILMHRMIVNEIHPDKFT